MKPRNVALDYRGKWSTVCENNCQCLSVTTVMWEIMANLAAEIDCGKPTPYIAVFTITGRYYSQLQSLLRNNGCQKKDGDS